MAHVSECIRPLKNLDPVRPEDAPANNFKWEFEDNTLNVFPHGRNGKSMKVTIIRRSLVKTSPVGRTEFKICRNNGWSWKIIRNPVNRQSSTVSVTKRAFEAELRRMGGTEEHVNSLKPL